MTGPEVAGRRIRLGVGALVLSLAVVARLLFWHASPDHDWPYSCWFKGDAVTWLHYAHAIDHDQAFELGLPLRPPAMGYLLAALWNGQTRSFRELRVVWCLMGGVGVLLLYLAATRAASLAVAGAVGLLAATSCGMMMLSSSLNGETPYLVAIGALLCLWHRMRRSPPAAWVVLWAAVNALTCLIRVEHLLFFASTLVALAIVWAREGGGRLVVAKRVGLTFLCFVAVLAPWHLKAWSGVRRFNTDPPPDSPSTELYRSIEDALEPLEWDRDAVRRSELLPAFCRDANTVFVAATVVHRGRRHVTAEDFSVIEEAFGTAPDPLARFPFVASYGPLNFYLANNPLADGGFSRASLEVPPPLKGGAQAYPHFLVQGLPPPDLAFEYPPHVEIFNHGYAKGWQWIHTHPAPALRLAARKLAIFWSGASLGLTGYNLPLGMDGVMRRVDIATPSPGWKTSTWQALVLLLTIAGLAVSWREPAVLPWTLLAATKVAITVAFFGYARQGATVIPVVLLLSSIAIERTAKLLAPKRQSRSTTRLVATMAAIAVIIGGAELVRWAQKPRVTIDGRTITTNDPFPALDHENRTIEVRYLGPT